MGLTEGQAHGGGRVEMVDGDAAGEEGGREAGGGEGSGMKVKRGFDPVYYQRWIWACVVGLLDHMDWTIF